MTILNTNEQQLECTMNNNNKEQLEYLVHKEQ